MVFALRFEIVGSRKEVSNKNKKNGTPVRGRRFREVEFKRTQ